MEKRKRIFGSEEKCNVLKRENKKFKDELRLRKENSHHNFKILNNLINLQCISFDNIRLGFFDGKATPSGSNKTVFVKAHEEGVSMKIKFHRAHSSKLGYTFGQCYASIFDNYQLKLNNLINKCDGMNYRLLKENDKIVLEELMSKKGEKKNEPQFQGSSDSHSWYLDSVCSYHMNMNKFLFTYSLNMI